MNYEDFNDFCGAMTATTHVIQWGGSHVWKVGEKVFAIGGWGEGEQPAYTFKTSTLDFEFLRQHEGYRPAPYFASRGMKWIQQTDTAGALDDELKHYLAESYRIVSLGLSKRKRQALGIDLKPEL